VKRILFVFSAIVFVALATLTSCNTPAQKVENAKDNVENAQDDLDKANREYLVEVENFRKEIAARTVTNDQLIAELKAKAALENRELKSDYQKVIASLEKKNSDMKKKLEDYKENGKENWASFRAELNHDMDELGKALKDFFINNKK
jgi:F0F1-type ATP synthase membrane subunit b/b'